MAILISTFELLKKTHLKLPIMIREEIRQSTATHSVAQLELVKAKNAIEQFIYSCSHTMRSPLKSISGLVFLLRNNEGIPKINSGYYLQLIENSVIKLESVLNDLEQFLRNSSENIATSPIDFNEFIGEVLSDFNDTIKQNEIHTEIVIKQSCPLFTDRSALRTIISHLISNAIVYQIQGGEEKQIRLTIKVTSTSCMIHVQDNGIGILEENLSRIFHLFYRGSEKSGGAGVGLYIASELLNKMDGTISVRSKPGKGSCFSILFPNLS